MMKRNNRFTQLVFMLLFGLANSTLDVGANTQLVWVHGKNSGPYLNGLFLAIALLLSACSQPVRQEGGVTPNTEHAHDDVRHDDHGDDGFGACAHGVFDGFLQFGLLLQCGGNP